MNAKFGLLLLLTLFTVWGRPDAPGIPPDTKPDSEEQAVLPLALKYRMQIVERIEAPPSLPAIFSASTTPLDAPGNVPPAPDPYFSALGPVLLLYVLMSLQR